MSGDIGRETALLMRAALCACPETPSGAPAVTAEATADLMKSLRSIVSPCEVWERPSKPADNLTGKRQHSSSHRWDVPDVLIGAFCQSSSLARSDSKSKVSRN